MTDASPRTTPSVGAREPPLRRGTYEDAVPIRRWSYRQRTATQRLEWLVSMLRVADQTGALKSRKLPFPVYRLN